VSELGAWSEATVSFPSAIVAPYGALRVKKPPMIPALAVMILEGSLPAIEAVHARRRCSGRELKTVDSLGRDTVRSQAGMQKTEETGLSQVVQARRPAGLSLFDQRFAGRDLHSGSTISALNRANKTRSQKSPPRRSKYGESRICLQLIRRSRRRSLSTLGLHRLWQSACMHAQ
jgi:hypothetical protein